MSISMRKYREEAGFTLIELVVSIVILGILSLVGYGIIALNASTFNMVNTNTIQRWDVRKAMQELKHDCQMIDPNRLVAVGGGGNKTDLLTFVTLENNTIRYKRNSSGILQKKINSGSWRNLVEHLTTAPFRFLNTNMAPTSVISEITFIEVDLQRTVDSKTFTLTEQFYVRN